MYSSNHRKEIHQMDGMSASQYDAVIDGVRTARILEAINKAKETVVLLSGSLDTIVLLKGSAERRWFYQTDCLLLQLFSDLSEMYADEIGPKANQGISSRNSFREWAKAVRSNLILPGDGISGEETIQLDSTRKED